jgi:hypothetical protein
MVRKMEEGLKYEYQNDKETKKWKTDLGKELQKCGRKKE